jgi:hypothetical protein
VVKIAQPRYQATLGAFYYNYLDLQVETLTNHGFTTVPQNAAQAKTSPTEHTSTA